MTSPTVYPDVAARHAAVARARRAHADAFAALMATLDATTDRDTVQRAMDALDAAGAAYRALLHEDWRLPGSHRLPAHARRQGTLDFAGEGAAG